MLLDADQDVQALYPPLLLAQQSLDPVAHCTCARSPSHSVNCPLDRLLRGVCSCLRKDSSALEQRRRLVECQPCRVRERRVEPWRMEVE